MTNNEELVFRTVADLVHKFVARDRDYGFNKDALEKVITSGEVTVKQISIWFYLELGKYFPDEQGRSTTSIENSGS